MLTRKVVQNTVFHVVHVTYGWLAVSRSGSLQIGVIGTSEQEARERFAQELEAWALLADQQEGEWT